MADTRNFIGLGVWAENAQTTIPPSPVQGTAYRDTTLSSAEFQTGEGYDTIPLVKDFNQKMYSVSSITDLTDKHGVPGWTALQDYTVPVLTWGSDNVFYEALLNSGPTLGGAVDPSGGSFPLYWSVVSASQVLALLAANTGSSLIGSAEGITVQAHFNRFAAYYRYTNDLPGTAIVSKNMTLINGSSGNYTATFTTPLSDANYFVFLSIEKDVGDIKGNYLEYSNATATSFDIRANKDTGDEEDAFGMSIMVWKP